MGKEHIAYSHGGLLTECGRLLGNVDLLHGGAAIRRAYAAGTLCRACRNAYPASLREVDCP